MAPAVVRTAALPFGTTRRRSRHRTRRALLYWCFLAPSLLIFLLYRIVPIVWNLVLSFQYWSPLAEAEPAGFDHYEDLLQDEVFWQALWNTLMVIASAPV